MNNEAPQNVQGQLRGLLSRLPDVPVASNFTARVMQAVELEEMRRSRWGIFEWNWRVFVPRTAFTAAVVGVTCLGIHEHELTVQRQKFQPFVAVAESMPSVDALKNFDAIQRMGQPAHPDDELLALASYMK